MTPPDYEKAWRLTLARVETVQKENERLYALTGNLVTLLRRLARCLLRHPENVGNEKLAHQALDFLHRSHVADMSPLRANERQQMTKKDAARHLNNLWNTTLPLAARVALSIAIRELDREFTSETPTLPDHYFWRKNETSPPKVICIVPLFSGSSLLVVESTLQVVEQMGGEWYGPLKPPE